MKVQALLVDYGNYHRDPRNKLTHYFGIPLIVLAIIAWLRLVHLTLGEVRLDAAMLLLPVLVLYYLWLSRPLGLAMAILLTAGYLLMQPVNAWMASLWFVVGWGLQFLGHLFEGKKPAFLKNGLHLLAGPLFILNQLFLKLSLPGGLKVS